MNKHWSYPADQELRGALFGCGQVSVYHMRAWQSIKNVRIVALANRTTEKAYSLADQFGVSKEHVYSSHLDLLENEELDFVDIATALDVHFCQVLDAAQYGRHILCQKPFAPSLVDALKMIHAAENAGVLLSINENWRWRNWYREIKRMIQSNVIGKPNYLYIQRHNNVTLPPNQGGIPVLLAKQPYTKDLQQLILFEWGIHVVDVARFLFGDVISLYATKKKITRIFNGEDRFILHLNFPDLDAVLDLSWATVSRSESTSHLEQVVVEGDGGMIQILPEPDDVIRLVTSSSEQSQPAFINSVDHAYQNSYTQAHQHFIDCLRNGNLPETHARDNIKTLATVFAAYESAQNNRVINLHDYFKDIGCNE